MIILVTVRHTLRGFKKIPIPTKYSDVIHTQSDSNSKLVEDLLSLVLIISFMHNNSILEHRMLMLIKSNVGKKKLTKIHPKATKIPSNKFINSF